MSKSRTLSKPYKSVSIAFGLMLGLVGGAFVAPVAYAGKPKAETLTAASDEQKAAAERVLYGKYQCELGKTITVTRDDQNAGYAKLQLGKQSWTMKPTLSATGAIRLEDVKGGTLLVQILTKSMLMDQKAGRRLVDGCAHETQKAAEEELKKAPRVTTPSDPAAPAAQ